MVLESSKLFLLKSNKTDFILDQEKINSIIFLISYVRFIFSFLIKFYLSTESIY